MQWPPMPESIIYESWGDLNPKDTLPKRSYLYHLKPIGVGSMQVESLTGYIARLAEAHSVTTGALLMSELLPRVVADPCVAARGLRKLQGSSFIYDAHILNGLGDSPRQLVRVLEALTGQDFLHTLTMLNWSQVICNHELLRRSRAWCVHCYDTWRNTNQPIYEPLLWNICAATICLIHERELERCCPHCKRESPLLTAKARPGYCYRCRGWLGIPVQGGWAECADAAELRIANAVGELMASGRVIQDTVSGAYFKENLMCCIANLADGNQSAFSRATGESLASLTYWLSPSTTFRLRPFLRMCSKLGISPVRILTERIPAGDHVWERTRDLVVQQSSSIRHCRSASLVRRALEEALKSTVPVSLRQVAQQLGYRHVCALRRRNEELCNEIEKKHGNIDTAAPRHNMPYTCPTLETAREALERAIRDSPYRSLNAICKEIGYRSVSSLYYHFPELCRAYVAKHREWREQEDQRVSDVITKALSQEPAPTMKEVAGRLGYRPGAFRRRFRNLCAALVARLPERKQFERERIRKHLEHALEQNPAPPMKVVAQSLHRHQVHLRVVFPDLYKKIKDRYIDYQKTLRSQRRWRFLAEAAK